ncbi:MAG: transposase [SAR202 cluster bacterium]|nr:transposase [SAR202 cluster bacterium]MDP6512084.1 transposase [SAR202 cluster bacterium]
MPFVTRTYGPVGSTPIIREYLTRDHLSAINGITPDGKLSMMVQPEAFRSAQVVKFLKHLLRQIGGKLLVIWDGSPIHRSNVIKDYLASGAMDRIHLERFPAYAPEMNPDEGIWNYLKRVELKNVACQNLNELGYELRKAKERLRHKQHAILGCIKQVGLD